MKVNGKQVALSKEMSQLAFLQEQGYPTDKVAVERNGQIVPKAQFSSVTLMDSDQVEIVSFVGGG